MGQDKSNIVYHDVPQLQHLINLCDSINLQPHISRSHTETQSYLAGIPIIKDRFIKLGPMGGILSAMLNDPRSAWLVMAIDLPHLDVSTLQSLIDARHPNRLATAYQLTSKTFPEPLVTIYEPASYPRMLSFLSLGYACPRKMLINSAVHIINTDRKDVFL